MFVYVLTLDLLFPGCQSLKQKRYALSSLKTRLRNKFNVSLAETDHHDKWQRCELAVVLVTREKQIAESSADTVLRFIEGDHRVQVADVFREFR